MEHTAFLQQRDYLLQSVDQHSSSLLASEPEICIRVNEYKVFTAGADLQVPLLGYVRKKRRGHVHPRPSFRQTLALSEVILPSLRACAAFRNSLLTDYLQEFHMYVH